MRVIAVIHRDEGGHFGISFPDFPGCVSGGETLDEVLVRGTDALNGHIALMLDDGDTVPAARSLDALRGDPEFAVDFEGAIVASVPAFIPGRKTQRVNITLDGDLLEAIDVAAKTFPGGRSGFLAQAAREKIVNAR
jgi:predicted RNase H-like HicB family nuclease